MQQAPDKVFMAQPDAFLLCRADILIESITDVEIT